MVATIDDAFAHLPAKLKKSLLDEYRGALRAYHRRQWEMVGLKAGKLCETVYSMLNGHASGTFPAAPSKPTNMVSACQAFEGLDKTLFPRSVRIQIPRMLLALYELRNNRDIGHVGGDVNSNQMDIVDAQSLVDSISERNISLLWTNEGKIRVLDPKLPFDRKALVVLYGQTKPIHANELAEHVEYSNWSMFRNKLLTKLHKDKLIDFDKKSLMVTILPPGENIVEHEIIPAWIQQQTDE